MPNIILIAYQKSNTQKIMQLLKLENKLNNIEKPCVKQSFFTLTKLDKNITITHKYLSNDSVLNAEELNESLSSLVKDISNADVFRKSFDIILYIDTTDIHDLAFFESFYDVYNSHDLTHLRNIHIIADKHSPLPTVIKDSTIKFYSNAYAQSEKMGIIHTLRYNKDVALMIKNINFILKESSDATEQKEMKHLNLQPPIQYHLKQSIDRLDQFIEDRESGYRYYFWTYSKNDITKAQEIRAAKKLIHYLMCYPFSPLNRLYEFKKELTSSQGVGALFREIRKECSLPNPFEATTSLPLKCN
jgi:hypothetical protein